MNFMVRQVMQTTQVNQKGENLLSDFINFPLFNWKGSFWK